MAWIPADGQDPKEWLGSLKKSGLLFGWPASRKKDDMVYKRMDRFRKKGQGSQENSQDPMKIKRIGQVTRQRSGFRMMASSPKESRDIRTTIQKGRGQKVGKDPESWPGSQKKGEDPESLPGS
jgi:hypothetical protein